MWTPPLLPQHNCTSHFDNVRLQVLGTAHFDNVRLQVLGTVVFDFAFVGTALATVTWFIANKYLRVQSLRDVEQE
eukprot:3218802-Rhodomonas_salina.1